MFQFTRFASVSYVFRYGYPRGWVSPFRDPGIKAYLPAPPGFSQAITSFFAYHRQGIHHMLLVTWPYNFDISFKISPSSSRTCQVFHLTRYAVMWIIPRLKAFLLFIWEHSSLLNFNQLSLIEYSFWRNQKIVIRGTVCTKPLRMCSFLWQLWFDSMNF